MTNETRPRTRISSLRPGAERSQKMQLLLPPLAPVTYALLHGAQRRSTLDGESVGRRGGAFSGCDRRFLVDQLLELFSGLEVRHLLRRHVDLVAGLGVASLPRLAFP